MKISWILIVTIAFIFIGLTVRNIHQWHAPLYDWDEAIYAQVGKELLHHPGIITTYDGNPWLEKPPIPFIIYAITFAIFGMSEFWLRMTSIITAIALFISMYILTRKLFNTLLSAHMKKFSLLEREVLYSIPILITASSVLFLDRAEVVNVDILLTVGWVGYLAFRENTVAKGVFLTIGVLTKSLLGFYPMIIDLLSLRNIKKTLLVTIPSLLWYVFAYLQFGNTFIQIHFVDHLVKRVTTPLELHFGGKFYYLDLLWNDYHWFTLLFILGYVVILYDWSRHRKHFVDYCILLSALPFIAFISISKSKLSWYLISALPLLSLSLPYAIARIKSLPIRVIGYCVVGIFFLMQFIPHTFAAPVVAGDPEKVTLARCLSEKATAPIAFLVDADERKIQNTLEAAHLQLETSFDYGGTPAFIYYVNKRVVFFYKTGAFAYNVLQYNSVVISKSDLASMAQELSAYKPICTTDSWVGLQK